MLCTPMLPDGLDESPFFCAMVNTETFGPVATPGQLAYFPLTLLEYLAWSVTVPASGTVTI